VIQRSWNFNRQRGKRALQQKEMTSSSRQVVELIEMGMDSSREVPLPTCRD